MKCFIVDGIVLTPDIKLIDTAIEIEEGKIQRFISNSEIPINQEIEVLSAKGCIITPGLIDIHVHGSNNADTMDSTYDAFNSMSKFFIEHGVTSFYATTLTADKENIIQTLQSIHSFQDSLDGANLLGAHLEGPFININYRGAQSPRHLRLAHSEEYKKWFEIGGVKLITIAPELEGSDELIEYGLKHGAEFALGHSGASYEEVLEAANRGVRQSTHTFNGMQGLHHRKPGTTGGILTDDRIYAQVIADGIHVHPAILKLLVRVKGVERTILITDAIRATGLTDGHYLLGDTKVAVKEGIARTDSGSLAGSTLTLDNAVRNIMRYAEVDFQSAIRMSTCIPAEAMRISSKKGNIKPGADADLAIFNADYHVIAAMVKGKVVYGKDKLKRR